MNYFIFKDIDSRSIEGLIVQELPPISKPAKKADKIEIDGRDGDIIEEKGYQAYDKTISIGLTKKYNINQIISWLNGTGKLTMSNEPNKYYNANIIEQIDFERLVRFKTAKIKFHCQPFKHKANEEYLLIKDRKDKTFSGENIGLNDSADMRLQELKICGNSRQKEKTDNLIDNIWQQGGITDITGIEQEDTKIRSDFIEVHSNNLYSIKRDVFNLYMAYRFYDKDKKYLGNQLTEAMLSSDKEDNRMNTNESSMTFTILNKNVRYMRIIDASNNLNTKYTLTTEARKPSYPSKIECCGDNVNLFDKDNVNFINAYLANNKTITSTNYVKTYYIECKANKTYTISKKIGKYFRVATSSKIPAINDTVSQIEIDDNNTNLTITTDNNAKYLLFNCRNNQIDTLTEQEILDSIKIEENSTPTRYSKFGQGNISFEMCNKNLFNKDKATVGRYVNYLTGNFVSSANYCTSDYIKILKKNVKISGTNEQLSFYDVNKKYISGSINANIQNIPINAKFMIITARISEIDNVQVEFNELTQYEPHKSQTHTIPVQKPFRKIDIYKDTFVKKDGKRYERHYIYRRILDGTEDWSYNSLIKVFLYNDTSSPIAKSFMKLDVPPPICSSHYIIDSWNSYSNKNNNASVLSYSWTYTAYRIRDDRFTTVEDFKVWLQEKYNADTPVYIDYVLSEPEDIECTSEQTEILDKIDNEAKTYKNITHIYSTDEVSTILEGTYFTTTNEKIENEGNIQSRPILRLEKIISESVELTINNIRFKYNFNNDEYVEIDCEEKTVKYEGLNRNRNISIGYDFPKLNIGDNNIIMHDGDCIIKILRKDRWL